MELKPSDLEVGKTYHTTSQAVREADLATCARLLGEDGDASNFSLGIVFVWALRSLIESDILPQGAIMVSHCAKWYRPPPTAGTVTTEMWIEAIDAASGRRYRHVVIAYLSRDEAQRDIVLQHQGVLWPT